MKHIYSLILLLGWYIPRTGVVMVLTANHSLSALHLAAPLPIFMLVFTFFKSGPRRQQTLSQTDVQVTCPLRAIWPAEWHTLPLTPGLHDWQALPTNAPTTEPSTTSPLTQQPLYKTAVVVSALFYVRS